MLERIQAVAAQVGAVVVGKQPKIKLALACLLARGHLLIEDLPGVGKTTLAHALSISLGLQFRRVQFTNDLLPADILGLSVYDRETAQFVFHPGPVFSQVLLADEINRASPVPRLMPTSSAWRLTLNSWVRSIIALRSAIPLCRARLPKNRSPA